MTHKLGCTLFLVPCRATSHLSDCARSSYTNNVFLVVSCRVVGAARVTRLGDFSPIGWLFSLGSFLENYCCSPKFLTSFFNGQSYVLILTNNGLGYILGDFYTILCRVVGATPNPPDCVNRHLPVVAGSNERRRGLVVAVARGHDSRGVGAANQRGQCTTKGPIL
jgi:hypothetical protein